MLIFDELLPTQRGLLPSPLHTKECADAVVTQLGARNNAAESAAAQTDQVAVQWQNRSRG